jgi:pimeloyl-ACP methyl ester carboxylesterase
MRGGGKVSKLVIVSGNGGGDVMRANWYASALRELSKALPHITVVCPQMPESEVAPEAVWVPHLLSLGVDHETVLVGHSSGACAATRLAEKHKLHTLVLVSACHTDQGDENERLSGYYNRPWLVRGK